MDEHTAGPPTRTNVTRRTTCPAYTVWAPREGPWPPLYPHSSHPLSLRQALTVYLRLLWSSTLSPQLPGLGSLENQRLKSTLRHTSSRPEC